MELQASQPSRPYFAVLLGGGIAATLDIVYACLSNAQYGKTPLWVLQSVATGWLGSQAFSSGLIGGLIGLVSHYSILIVAATVYLMLSKRFAVLRTQAVAYGAVFGALVYLFMNFVVLPLSAFPFKLSYPPLRLIEGLMSHALFVGIPIALCIRRWLRPSLSPSVFPRGQVPSTSK
jgi:hypothetical protein